MTPTSAAVAAFRVPPLVKSVQLQCGIEHAFDVFTAGIHRWWPLQSHSIAQSADAHVEFEPRRGGRLFERSAAGVEHTWGSVTAWEPPNRVAFTWHVGREPDAAQVVEVVFTPVAGGGTRVELTHSGWEALGERGEAMRGNYNTGWDHVFGTCFAECAARQAP